MFRKLSIFLIAIFTIAINTLPITATQETSLRLIDGNVDHWAIIVCGGFLDFPNSLVDGTRHAYNILKSLGYEDDHIYYFQQGNSMVEQGVDGFSNKSKIKFSITNWLANNSDENDECFIYFFCHGYHKANGSCVLIYETIKSGIWTNTTVKPICSKELSLWLDQVKCNIISILIESCKSGDFIDDLSKDNRIIMTSSNKWDFATGPTNRTSFSNYFFDKIQQGTSIGEAWEYADNKLLNYKVRDMPEYSDDWCKNIRIKIILRLAILFQNPQIDDNGDGKGYGRALFTDKLPIGGDGFLALRTYL